MKHILKEDFKDKTVDDFLDSFDFFSKVIRDMLRYLCSIKAYDHATILEMLWKIVLVTFDESLTSYSKTVSGIKKSVRSGARKVQNEMDAIILRKDNKFHKV